MKRWIPQVVIVGYLSVLMYGLFCHALYYKINQHPAMYWIVWDMYCGWSAYETRNHVIGEGESGQYYELAPGPWGSFKPHGDAERRHYDYTGLHSVSLALNTLRHTEHEPMARLLIVEETWPRKYNLSDELWARRYTEPKDKQSYYQMRAIYTPDGRLTHEWPSWLTRVSQECVLDNPRLLADMKKGRPFYAVEPGASRSRVVPTAYELPTAQ